MGFGAVRRQSRCTDHSPAPQSYWTASPHSKDLSDIKQTRTAMTILAKRPRNNRLDGRLVRPSTDAKTVLFCCKASGPSLLERLAGDQVMFSSLFAVFVIFCFLMNFCCLKAVLGLELQQTNFIQRATNYLSELFRQSASVSCSCLSCLGCLFLQSIIAASQTAMPTASCQHSMNKLL